MQRTTNAYPSTWQKVGADLFLLAGKPYRIVVNYFSRYPEVISLSSTSSPRITARLKTLFATQGIPETVVSDKGPQFSLQEFMNFLKEYNFCHKTRSPHSPHSNRQAERGVQTVKGLLKDDKDPHLSLLAYRTIPQPWCKLSPVQLLRGEIVAQMFPNSQGHLLLNGQY